MQPTDRKQLVARSGLRSSDLEAVVRCLRKVTAGNVVLRHLGRAGPRTGAGNTMLLRWRRQVREARVCAGGCRGRNPSEVTRMATTQTSVPSAPRRIRQAVPMVTITPALRWLVVRFSDRAAAGWRAGCSGCGSLLRPATAPGAALRPAGRCGQCHARVGAPPWLLEAVTAAVAVIAVLAAPTWPMLVAVLWWTGCVVPLVFIDLRAHRLPDPLTFAALSGVLLFETLDAVLADRWDALVRAVSATAVYGLIFLVLAMVLGRRGPQLGDVKLMLSISALLGWWGWDALFGGVFLGSLGAMLTGGLLLATKRVQRDAHIAVGPFFVGGAVAMLVLLGRSATG
jgi:leader peptidase (prepilin peptidase)/N-methyltransferase